MTTPVRSVTEVRAAVEQILRDHLDEVMSDMGFAHHPGVVTWQQLPTAEALVAAEFPAGIVTSTGTVGEPTFSRASGLWTYTWEIAVGLYDRGDSHSTTQGRIGDWCAGIRTTLLRHRSLDGIAVKLKTVGEDYSAVSDRGSARTLGAGAVAFHISAEVTTASTAPLPTVLTTKQTIEINEP